MIRDSFNYLRNIFNVAGWATKEEKIPMVEIQGANEAGDQVSGLRINNGAAAVEVTGRNALIDGEKTSNTPGTPVALVAESTSCKSVIVVAKTDNTDVVYIGGETPKIGFSAGKGVSISIDDLAKVYIDPAVSGDGVDYLAEV